MFAINIENLKTLKYYTFQKTVGLSLVCSKYSNECKKCLKKKYQTKY